jgi:hypothetical protein
VGGEILMAQSTKDATKFYEAKVEDLGNNLKDLETIIGQKSNNLRVVEDGKLDAFLLCFAGGKGTCAYWGLSIVLRQKVLGSGAGPSAQAA